MHIPYMYMHYIPYTSYMYMLLQLVLTLLTIFIREELKELRKQMGDIEKSLMQQVVTNEKRAEETLVGTTS